MATGSTTLFTNEGANFLGNFSSDPGATTNGTTYYNTTNKILRVCLNGIWTTIANTSASATQEVVNRARIDSAGNITSSSGFLSGVVKNATGDYTLTFAASTYSAAPTCILSTENNGYVGNIKPGISSSSVTVLIYAANTLTAADQAFDIVCIGPK